MNYQRYFSLFQDIDMTRGPRVDSIFLIFNFSFSTVDVPVMSLAMPFCHPESCSFYSPTLPSFLALLASLLPSFPSSSPFPHFYAFLIKSQSGLQNHSSQISIFPNKFLGSSFLSLVLSSLPRLVPSVLLLTSPRCSSAPLLSFTEHNP